MIRPAFRRAADLIPAGRLPVVAAHVERRRTEFSADYDDRAVSVGTIEREAPRRRCLRGAPSPDYIGGIRPSLPNRTAPACMEPSACRSPGTNTASPARMSEAVDGTSATTGTFAGMSIFFSPPL